LFESSWKKKYTDRGIRKTLGKYSKKAGLSQSISPHMMRHFLFTWLKKQGIDDAFILNYLLPMPKKNMIMLFQIIRFNLLDVRFDALGAC
jgi:hypothetical protein